MSHSGHMGTAVSFDLYSVDSVIQKCIGLHGVSAALEQIDTGIFAELLQSRKIAKLK